MPEHTDGRAAASSTPAHTESVSLLPEAEAAILLVLVHGNNAGPADWRPIERLVCEQARQRGTALRLRILKAKSNAFDTHGGVELLGRRLADEIVQVLISPAAEAAEDTPAAAEDAPAEDESSAAEDASAAAAEDDPRSTVVYETLSGSRLRLPDGCSKPVLHLVGHSLGGLVARWCIGHLGACGVLALTQPGVFMSLASPHLGVRAPGWHITRSWINLVSPHTVCGQSTHCMWSVHTLYVCGQSTHCMYVVSPHCMYVVSPHCMYVVSPHCMHVFSPHCMSVELRLRAGFAVGSD